MLYGVYAVYDAAARSYLQPFTAVNDDVAIRQFAGAFMDDGTIMANNPSDFDLCLIGTYNPQEGKVEGVDRAIIARGTDYAN